MEDIYSQYLLLTAGQRKLLCFFAYLGHEGNVRSMSLYRKVEELNSNQIEKLQKSLTAYLRLRNYYNQEYALEPAHVSPLMVYMLKKMPQWLEYFNKFYQHLQAPEARSLLTKLALCVKGDVASFGTNGYDNKLTSDMLVPLVSHKEFLPLLLELPDYRIPDFINTLALYQVKNDIPDPENMLGRILELRNPLRSIHEKSVLQSVIALYDFFKQGRFNEHVAGYNNQYSKILTGVRALYLGDYDLAFASLTAAIRERN